jgi:hypothetical protein
MSPTRIEAIGSRSGAVARIQFGEPGPYLPLMSELRRQLLTLESAVAVARGIVQPTEAPSNKSATSVLLQAAAFIDALDASLEWIDASQELTYGPFQFPLKAGRLSAGATVEETVDYLRIVRKGAESAIERFDQLRAPAAKELAAKTMLKSVFAAGTDIEKTALGAYAAGQKVQEMRAAAIPADEVEEASLEVANAALQIQEMLGDKRAVRQAAIALLPILAYKPGEDLPILRIKQESPLEVVVILIGSAGALVAALNGLLDVQVKYKTRKEKERAARSRLERELAEDEAKTKAIEKLRATFSYNEPNQLKMEDFAVFDSLEEAFGDDEEMKAT